MCELDEIPRVFGATAFELFPSPLALFDPVVEAFLAFLDCL